MTRDLQSLLASGVGSDRWFHRRNLDYETKPGSYRAQVIDKRWWIIDLQNGPWLSTGICHITYSGDADPKGALPSGEAVQRRYGDADTWARAQARRLRQWGSSTVGAWSSKEMFSRGLAYTVMLGVPSRVQRDVGLHGGFPDVFSDRCGLWTSGPSRSPGIPGGFRNWTILTTIGCPTERTGAIQGVFYEL
jgi:hypothetical protein